MATYRGSAGEPTDAAGRDAAQHDSMQREVERLLNEPPSGPWTLAGGPDPAYTAVARERNRAWLTDPRLAERFQQLHPGGEPVYERMVRALKLVWDCPDDGSVNVVGYRCAGCGASREVALLTARCRDGRADSSRVGGPNADGPVTSGG